jgi:hypothetical protein
VGQVFAEGKVNVGAVASGRVISSRETWREIIVGVRNRGTDTRPCIACGVK